MDTTNKEELFSTIFAENGNREDIRKEDWTEGWSKIVGGINGIPTSRQFNALQYITDLKSLYLYANKLDKTGNADNLTINGQSLKEFIEAMRRELDELSQVAFSGDYNDLINKPELVDMTVINQHVSDKNNPHKVTKEQVGLSNVPNVATNDQTPTYTTASVRENLSSGEKLSTVFGKIRRWFADLKAVAFSGNYQDLTNKPSSLPANGGNADTVDGYHADNLMIYKTNYYNGNIDTLTNTCTLFMQGATCTTIPKSPDKNESIYYGYLTHIRGLNNDWQYQLMKTLSGTLYFRQKKSNVWETAWTAANDNGNAKMVNGIKIYSSIKEIGSYSTISNVCKNMPLSSILVSYAFRNEYTDLPQSGNYWNLHIHKDFEGHCIINAVHFSGGLPGNNCYSHTDITAGWEIVWKTNSVEGHTHNNIQGKGKLPATTSSVHGEGLSMGYVYNNGYPIPYGNVLRMGGEGDGELLIGWSGATGEKAPAYIRSCRDSGSTWSDWDKIITEMYLSNNVTTTAAGYALDARQGKVLNDKINNLMSAATSAYSVYYPEKNYTMNNIGTGSNQSYGFLNLYRGYNVNTELFSVTSTLATSANCTGIDNYPSNYITINQNGLYQIEVRLYKNTDSNSFRATLRASGMILSDFGCPGNAVSNTIQYLTKGTKIYVVIAANATSGSVSLNVLADVVVGILCGLYIKKIM